MNGRVRAASTAIRPLTFAGLRDGEKLALSVTERIGRAMSAPAREVIELTRFSVGTASGFLGSYLDLGGLRPQVLYGSSIDLEGSDCAYCDFSSVGAFVLTNALGANLTGADLGNGELTATSKSGHIVGQVSSGNYTVAHGYLVGPHATLKGLDLSGDPIENVDLTGANFAGANLSGDFIGFDTLQGADFAGANLSGVTFWNESLQGTLLAGATSYVDTSGQLLTGTPATLPAGWVILNRDLWGPTANVYRYGFSGLDLSGVNLSDANFRGPSLQDDGPIIQGIADAPAGLPAGYEFVDGTIIGPGVDIGTSNLAGADLSSADLTDVATYGTSAAPASLPAGWHFLDGHFVGPGADLTGAILQGADLAGVDLAGAQLDVASLTGANLSGTDLSGAALQLVQSGGITGTPSALPTGYELNGGFLLGPSVSLTGADLSGVDLSHADLSEVWSGSITGTPAALPPGYTLVTGWLVGPGVNLERIHSGLDLAGADLQGANLFGANLGNDDLAGANLSGAFMDYAQISNTNLSGANLSGATAVRVFGTASALPPGWVDLNGSLFGPGARVAQADVTSADLSHVELDGVASGLVTGLPAALPARWRLVGGYLVGPRANLFGAELSGLDLSAADLAGVGSGDVLGPVLLPAGWSLTGGYLVGAGANLAGAPLAGANLVGRDLSGANLAGAQLSGANLAGATLDGVDLAGANLAGADLVGVTSAGIVGTPASLPAGWSVVGGKLVLG